MAVSSIEKVDGTSSCYVVTTGDGVVLELPLLPKIRIYMEEKRPNILPLSLIFSGCITILISVSMYEKLDQSVEISKLITVIIPQSLANILE